MINKTITINYSKRRLQHGTTVRSTQTASKSRLSGDVKERKRQATTARRRPDVRRAQPNDVQRGRDVTDTEEESASVVAPPRVHNLSNPL